MARRRHGEGSAIGAEGRVAFLFLGELFLIAHLLPIAMALARRADAPAITVFVISSVHEEIVLAALQRAGLRHVIVRRAAGFRTCPPGARTAPHLPHKLLTLARNAAAILVHDVAVVAERTSLWIPHLARGGTSFIYNEHGAGPHANFRSPRNRAAARILMPGGGMAARARECGDPAAPIEVVGYIKRDFLRECGSAAMPHFAARRPTAVYVPHWLRCKSSWWSAGERVLAHFAASPDHNLILAPHMRLPEIDPDFEARIAPYRGLPNIHIDTASFSLMDQSYTNGADLYIGDGSSQVLEYAERPRPAIFLNPDGIDWREDGRFSHWRMGEVVDDVADLGAAMARAPGLHRTFAGAQSAYVARMMGIDDGKASQRAANVVLDVLAERGFAGERVPPVAELADMPALAAA